MKLFDLDLTTEEYNCLCNMESLEEQKEYIENYVLSDGFKENYLFIGIAYADNDGRAYFDCCGNFSVTIKIIKIDG